MKGRYRQAACIRAFDQLANAGFHFARGFIGKGHGNNVLRTNATLFDQIGDLARNDAGFAATRASQYQQWTADVLDGFLLTGIEACHWSAAPAVGVGNNSSFCSTDRVIAKH